MPRRRQPGRCCASLAALEQVSSLAPTTCYAAPAGHAAACRRLLLPAQLSLPCLHSQHQELTRASRCCAELVGDVSALLCIDGHHHTAAALAQA